MDSEELYSGLTTTDAIADYNLSKLFIISSATKAITNIVLQNIRSESLPSELDDTFDIYIVEAIKSRLSKEGEK